MTGCSIDLKAANEAEQNGQISQKGNTIMEARRMKKRYVQFSKRIVVAITAAVTALCVLSVCLCFGSGQMAEAVEVIKAYIGYATVVFVAYSGNSAAEKWLISKYGGAHTDVDTDYSNG